MTGVDSMRSHSHSRPTAILLGLVAAIAWSTAGCGGGSPTTVELTPEAQKKTNDYLQNYQKQMFEQHKAKPSRKK
jgi:hypothetical protein